MGGESRDTGFGEALRAAREEAGLSRQDLAETTRVPLRHLEALEEERWDSLPRGVIGRGFVRLVAKDLGLPAEELLERYRRARGEVEGPAPLVIPQSQWAPELRRERGPGPVLIATLLLVGAALGIWVWSPWSVERPAPVPGVEAPEAVLPRPIPVAPAPSGELPQSQPEAPPEAAPELPSEVGGVPPTPEPEVQTAVEPPSAAAPSPEAAPDDRGAQEVSRLEILAVEKVWLRITADGGRPQERLLEPGERVVVEAREGVALRLGSAGAVRFTWNGDALKVPGPPGAVMNLSFPADLEGLRP